MSQNTIEDMFSLSVQNKRLSLATNENKRQKCVSIATMEEERKYNYSDIYCKSWTQICLSLAFEVIFGKKRWHIFRSMLHGKKYFNAQ